MSVFRVEKNRNYTVMSNHHLKDKSLSLKGKGLLSMILSLPDEWNYTTRGLAAICREGEDSIGATLRELEAAGYLERHRIRDGKGRISDTEYVIYEYPQDRAGGDMGKPDTPMLGTPPPNTLSPCTGSPCTENPYLDEPSLDEPYTDKPAQLSTDTSNSPNRTNHDESNTHLSIMDTCDDDLLANGKHFFLNWSIIALRRYLVSCCFK